MYKHNNNFAYDIEDELDLLYNKKIMKQLILKIIIFILGVLFLIITIIALNTTSPYEKYSGFFQKNNFDDIVAENYFS